MFPSHTLGKVFMGTHLGYLGYLSSQGFGGKEKTDESGLSTLWMSPGAKRKLAHSHMLISPILKGDGFNHKSSSAQSMHVNTPQLCQPWIITA